MKIVLASLLSLTLSLCLTACGGGGGGGGDSTQVFTSTTTTTTTGENTHPIVVNGGPLGIPNLAFTSVTVCVPNTSQCQTIDNVIVDTGSTGLRLVPSAINAANLPAQLAPDSNPLYACVEYVDLSYGWGSVRNADVKLGEYVASNISIHIIDGSPSTRPTKCGNGNTDDDISTVANMGANGILGIGHHLYDCGPYCVTNASDEGYYFSCSVNTCTPSAVPLNAQIKNPIAFFANDNNGVIIDLPAVPAGGSAVVNGYMIFGVNTRSNNSLTGKTIITTSNTARVITRYNNVDYPESFIDSGSNGLFFPDTLTKCPGFEYFYCPANTQQLTATITGIGPNSSSAPISFSIANANTLNFNLNAFSNLGGYFYGAFDWGLPFFYGRKVYTGFETDPQGPFTAF